MEVGTLVVVLWEDVEEELETLGEILAVEVGLEILVLVLWEDVEQAGEMEEETLATQVSGAVVGQDGEMMLLRELMM